MKRVKHTCESCGAPLPMTSDNGMVKCPYCGAIYTDESSSITHLSDIKTQKPIENTPEFIAKERTSNNKLVIIFISIFCLVGFSFFVFLSGNTQNTNKDIIKTKPEMLLSLPKADYTGKSLAFDNWEILVDPSIYVNNNQISISLNITNWNNSSQILRFKVKNLTLYDDVGNTYPINMDGCDEDAAFLDNQISFESNENINLTSSTVWCQNKSSLPFFVGTIPNNAKHFYLRLVDFGVFSEITFVYNL